MVRQWLMFQSPLRVIGDGVSRKVELVLLSPPPLPLSSNWTLSLKECRVIVELNHDTFCGIMRDFKQPDHY